MSSAPPLLPDPPARLVSYNPATGEPLGAVPIHSSDDVEAMVVAARVAQVAWGALSVKQRCQQLKALLQTTIDNQDRIVDLLNLECGKPRYEAYSTEVFNFFDLAHHYIKRGPRVLKQRGVGLHLFPHKRSYLHYKPRGVVGVIGPWNFPFLLNAVPAFMAAVAGSATIIKPSEITPLITVLFKELWDESGLPPDLIQVATGYGATGAAVVDRVDQVVFTGSVKTGRLVAEACARRLIPCTLELGGKHPSIVYPDANLDRVADGITWGAFVNSGQVCASVERLYVHEAVHDELVGRLVEKATALRHGDPTDPETEIGAIIFDHQMDVAEAQVADALAKGATLKCGSEKRLGGPGQFYPPTILTGVTHEMTCAREETFAPLLPIIKWTDEEEVIRLANDSHLGLHASIWTRDVGRGRRTAERIRSGTTMVNDLISSNGMPEAPWHGVKSSGLGQVHADDGLRSLCEMRHVNHPRPVPWLTRELWWYPYTPGGWKLLRYATRLLFGKARKGTAAGDLPPQADPATALPKATLPVTPSAR